MVDRRPPRRVRGGKRPAGMTPQQQEAVDAEIARRLAAYRVVFRPSYAPEPFVVQALRLRLGRWRWWSDITVFCGGGHDVDASLAFATEQEAQDAIDAMAHAFAEPATWLLP